MFNNIPTNDDPASDNNMASWYATLNNAERMIVTNQGRPDTLATMNKFLKERIAQIISTKK